MGRTEGHARLSSRRRAGPCSLTTDDVLSSGRNSSVGRLSHMLAPAERALARARDREEMMSSVEYAPVSWQPRQGIRRADCSLNVLSCFTRRCEQWARAAMRGELEP